MDFVELPEHLPCSFTGTNSPAMLRVEANDTIGGFMLEEFADKPPHVTITGDTASARTVFRRTIEDLRYYVGLLERHELVRSDDMQGRLGPWCFLLDLRQPCGRISLFGTGSKFEFHTQGDWQRADIDIDLSDACDRLKATFERFYDVRL